MQWYYGQYALRDAIPTGYWPNRAYPPGIARTAPPWTPFRPQQGPGFFGPKMLPENCGVGAPGDPCATGYTRAASGVKYVVQKQDVINGPWWICKRFGQTDAMAHATLRKANSETGTASEDHWGSCVLNLFEGQLINIPIGWFLGDTPKSWTDAAAYLRKFNTTTGAWDIPWSAGDCPIGYAMVNGRCTYQVLRSPRRAVRRSIPYPIGNVGAANDEPSAATVGVVAAVAVVAQVALLAGMAYGLVYLGTKAYKAASSDE